MQGTWFRSLAGDLGSYLPWSSYGCVMQLRSVCTRTRELRAPQGGTEWEDSEYWVQTKESERTGNRSPWGRKSKRTRQILRTIIQEKLLLKRFETTYWKNLPRSWECQPSATITKTHSSKMTRCEIKRKILWTSRGKRSWLRILGYLQIWLAEIQRKCWDNGFYMLLMQNWLLRQRLLAVYKNSRVCRSMNSSYII